MTKILTEAAILVVISALAAWATFEFHPKRPMLYSTYELNNEVRDVSESKPEPSSFENGRFIISQITLEQIEKFWNGDVHWIDARPSDKFEDGHIPGAISLNDENFYDDGKIEAIQNLKGVVVIYCGTERCKNSEKIAVELKHFAGSFDLYILKGGWPAWKEANS